MKIIALLLFFLGTVSHAGVWKTNPLMQSALQKGPQNIENQKACVEKLLFASSARSGHDSIENVKSIEPFSFENPFDGIEPFNIEFEVQSGSIFKGFIQVQFEIGDDTTACFLPDKTNETCGFQDRVYVTEENTGESPSHRTIRVQDNCFASWK